MIVLGGTSCKSLKSLSSKDISVNQKHSASTANKKVTFEFRGNRRKPRPGQHSKNASKGQTGFKKKYRGQGR